MGSFICIASGNSSLITADDDTTAQNQCSNGTIRPATELELSLINTNVKLKTDIKDANDKYTTLANAPKDNGWVMNTVEDAFPSALGTGIVLGMSSTAKPAAVWELARIINTPPATLEEIASAKSIAGATVPKLRDATSTSLFRAAGTTAFKRAGLAGGLASGVITYYGRKDEVDDGYITQDQFMYEVGSEAACGLLVAGFSSAVGLAVAGACVGSAVPGAGTILGFAAGLTFGLFAAYLADEAQEAIGHEVITDYKTQEMIDAKRAERRVILDKASQSK